MKPTAFSVLPLLVSVSLLLGCASVPDSTEITGTPEEEVSSNQNSLVEPLPVGTTILATTNVNLRSSASKSASILHVVPEGAAVTLVSSNPKNGFYNVKHDGTVGWSYASYYKVAPAPVAFTPEELIAKLGSCQQLAGTSKFRTDVSTSQTVPVCAKTGVIWWKSDFDVDCDGGSSATCKNDPYYQPETATVDSKGNPLDASYLPFVVIPGSSNGFNYKNHGLKMGSVVLVIYNGKISYGILGDVGPTGVIGEGSYAMAKELGINPSPTSGGVDSGVTYVAFTGASAVVLKKEDHNEAVQIGQKLGSTFVQSN